jgi:hypothetical protein
MSFQSDVTGVLKAEIGPSASVFFKKCMIQLKLDPNAITPADVEAIADWVYEEIRSMIDDKTAFRIQHQILQIPPNATVLNRPFASQPVPVRHDSPAEAKPQTPSGPAYPTVANASISGNGDNVKTPDSLTPHRTPEILPSSAPVISPEVNMESRREPDIVELFGKMVPKSQEPAPHGNPSAGLPALPRSSEISEEPSGTERRVNDNVPEPARGDDAHEDFMEDIGSVDPSDAKPATLADQLDYHLSRLETEGDNPELWMEIATLYSRSAKFRDAIPAYQRIIELGIETPNVWNCLGDSYKKTGQYEDSDMAYARSLELDPDDPVVWLKRAKVQTSRNRYDDALVCCDHSLTLDESSTEAWHYKAFVLKKVKRNDEALEIYTYLHELNPQDENAARQKAAIQKMLQNESRQLLQTQ